PPAKEWREFDAWTLPPPPPAPVYQPPPPPQPAYRPPPPAPVYQQPPPQPAYHQPPPQPQPAHQTAPPVAVGYKYCAACGAALHLQAVICPSCGVPAGVQPSAGASGFTPEQLREAHSAKVTAGLLAIFLGGLGIHKFYMGFNGAGLVYLLILIFTIGI